MRISVLLTLAVLAGLAGNACIQPDPQTLVERDDIFAVTLTTPAGSRSVPQKTVVQIIWRSYKESGRAATVDLILEHRPSLQSFTLKQGIPIPEGNFEESVGWDAGQLIDGDPNRLVYPAGTYVIRARIVADGQVKHEATAGGQITVDGEPRFTFLEPAEDASVPEDEQVTLTWEAVDAEGDATARIGIDSDADHASGNEIFIHDVTLEDEATQGTFAWDGTDADSARLAIGSYYLFAIVDDKVNAVRVVSAAAQIIIPDPLAGPDAAAGGE